MSNTHETAWGRNKRISRANGIKKAGHQMNKTIKLYASAVKENLVTDHGFTPVHADVKTSLQSKKYLSVRKLFLNGLTPVEAAKKINDAIQN